jgi:hypothetical protein
MRSDAFLFCTGIVLQIVSLTKCFLRRRGGVSLRRLSRVCRWACAGFDVSVDILAVIVA